MKKFIFALFIFCTAFPLIAQEADTAAQPQINELVDLTYSEVLKAIPRKYGESLYIAIYGLDLNGEPTPLGEYFSASLTTRLANSGRSDLKILARQHDQVLMQEGHDGEAENIAADYAINGKVFRIDGFLEVVIQIIDITDGTIAGGFESSIPLGPEIEQLLLPSAALAATGGDRFEPDGVSTAIELEPGEPGPNRTLAPEGDEDWYVVNAPDYIARGILTIYTEGNTDTYIEVYGPDDHFTLIGENDDGEIDSNAYLPIILEPSQTIWIKVRGYDSSTTGAYNLTVEFEEMGEDPNEPDNSMEEANTLNLDSDFFNQIMPAGDEDWYAVELPDNISDDTVLSVETSGELDTFIELYSIDGDELVSDDDSGSDNNARIDYLPGDLRNFYIKVKHYDNTGFGEYSIHASLTESEFDEYEPDNGKDSAKEIFLNDSPQERNFTPTADHDWLSFSLERSTTVVIETFGDADTYIELYDRLSNLITEDDDSGSDYNARIERRLQRGTYYIDVYQLEEGGYYGAPYSIELRD